MATDTNKDGNEGKEVVTFDEKQQAAIQTIIDERFGKINAKHQKELTDKLAEAERKADERVAAEAAKHKKDGKGDVDPAAIENQYKELLTTEKTKTKNAELVATQRQQEAEKAQAELLKVKKENAIAKAASKQNFYELDVVTKMTWDNVEFDAETGAFVVKEGGVVKQNSSLQPMTLEEYFSSFAAQRPYLVNGDVKGGAGSSGSRKTDAAIVRSKADLKTPKDKSDFMDKFPGQYESLPLK